MCFGFNINFQIGGGGWTRDRFVEQVEGLVNVHRRKVFALVDVEIIERRDFWGSNSFKKESIMSEKRKTNR